MKKIGVYKDHKRTKNGRREDRRRRRTGGEENKKIGGTKEKNIPRYEPMTSTSHWLLGPLSTPFFVCL